MNRFTRRCRRNTRALQQRAFQHWGSLASVLFFGGLVCLGAAWPAQVVAASPEDSATPGDSPKQDRLAIVDRAIEYHGGDLYQASQTRLTIRSRSGSFEIVSRMDGDVFEHQVSGTTAQGQTHRARATNDTVERWLNGDAVELDAEAAQRARDFVNARIYFPFLPFRLNDPGVYKQDLGLETWGERSLHKVKVTFEPGSSTDASDEYLYWFDPETARLEQFAYSFANNPRSGGLRLRRAFNHRWVGGLLFFDAENWGLNGAGDLKVDAITPAYVRESFDKISTVVLEDIHVEALESPAADTTGPGATAQEKASSASLTLEDLSWLAGHWVGEKHGGLVEESWLAPAGGTMAGVFRWMGPEGVRVYEMLALESTVAGLVMSLKHFGAGLSAWDDEPVALAFQLTEGSTRHRPVFEYLNPELDRSIRLTLDFTPPDSLAATVDFEQGGQGDQLAFEYRRAGSEDGGASAGDEGR